MPKTKTSTKPCPIPRDLKEGDVLVCNLGEQLSVIRWNCRPIYDQDGDISTSRATDGRTLWSKNGRSYMDPKNRWIVRIIRKTPPKPAKAKMDRDAAYILSICEYSTPHGNRRLRAIAKRLNGGGL